MKADYGIDAPNVIRNMLLVALAAAAIGSFLALQEGRLHRLGFSFLMTAGGFTLVALVMLWSSLFGKFGTSDKLLAAIPWRGGEQVLDAGCGHGMMLIAAAKRLTTGRAIGVDIWSQIDQAQNSAEATRRNAETEGVSERVEIRDADIRRLPFDDGSFDVVVSSLVIHNISAAREREQALAEIGRVLKHGGYFAVIDISRNYGPWLVRNGFTIEKRSLNLLFSIPTRAILARKL
ncbi:MAG TPA: class I SAM-dependent methyltransferase [Thermoanaerobaculia bacterium]|jgi:SAM-dependent methyltransferase